MCKARYGSRLYNSRRVRHKGLMRVEWEEYNGNVPEGGATDGHAMTVRGEWWGEDIASGGKGHNVIKSENTERRG